MCALYQRRRDLVMDALGSIGLSARVPKGTIYVWAKIPEGYTSAQYAGDLLDKVGVIVAAGQRVRSGRRGLHPHLARHARRPPRRGPRAHQDRALGSRPALRDRSASHPTPNKTASSTATVRCSSALTWAATTGRSRSRSPSSSGSPTRPRSTSSARPRSGWTARTRGRSSARARSRRSRSSPRSSRRTW